MGEQVRAERMVSIFERRRQIAEAINTGSLDRAVVDLLLEDGTFNEEESPYWDYKIELPSPPIDGSESSKETYSAKSNEIVKDCVAFYNSFGGYIVAGIRDSDKKIVGFSSSFDATDINKKIFSATGHSVETVYKEIDVSDVEIGTSLGLLFIPQRVSSVNPAQFKKDAPRSNGKPAYRARTFYMRERDICRNAETPEDFEFLYGSRKNSPSSILPNRIESNLPAREADFDGLIGRDAELLALWGWLSDVFNPIKIICGLGGLGKTSLAYTFAERLLTSSATDFDRLIWLSAKEHTFSAERDKEVPTQRLDFSNIEELLNQILLESGCPSEQIPENADRDILLGLCKENLAAFSYLLVIDNVDTLPDDDQQLLFHIFTQLCSAVNARCILTARRNLGAPISAYIELQGLPKDEFELFVTEKGSALGVSASLKKNLLKSLFEASGGSPLFAQSILRFVALGDTLQDAIQNWKGDDGEAVRDAAFSREIGRLKRNEARTLLALCYLQTASVIELGSVLGLSRFEIQESIETLRSFGMTNSKTNLPGGVAFQPSPAISLVTRLVEQRVGDDASIRGSCKQFRKANKNKKPHIAHAVSRSLALIDQGDTKGAVDLVRSALKDLPDDPDLLCLLGRSLKANGRRTQSIEAYQRAYALKCRKRELFVGWTQALEELEDWIRVIEVSGYAEKALRSSQFCIVRARALAEVGHEKIKVGDYGSAMSSYENGLMEVREGLNRYRGSSDRVKLWKESDELAFSWLGAASLKESYERGDGYKLFSSHFRAVTFFGTRRKTAFEGALSALSFWLERLRSRPKITEKTMENLVTARNRLNKILVLVEDRAHVGGDDLRRIQNRSARLADELEDLLG